MPHPQLELFPLLSFPLLHDEHLPSPVLELLQLLQQDELLSPALPLPLLPIKLISIVLLAILQKMLTMYAVIRAIIAYINAAIKKLTPYTVNVTIKKIASTIADTKYGLQRIFCIFYTLLKQFLNCL